MTPGEPLPDDITLSRAEAATILFALDEAIEQAGPDAALRLRLEAAARIIVERFLPDLPDL
jgi:hypothetical protein